MTSDRLSNPAFLSAREAAHTPPEPVPAQERADHAAAVRAVMERDAGNDLQDLFRRAQAARELC